VFGAVVVLDSAASRVLTFLGDVRFAHNLLTVMLRQSLGVIGIGQTLSSLFHPINHGDSFHTSFAQRGVALSPGLRCRYQ